MTFLELLEQLNALDEHSQIEAKTARDVGRSLWETISAFSNEPGLGGGHILLGVARAEDSLFPSYEVVGVPDSDKLQSDIASQCASVFNRPIRPEITPDVIEGKRVLKLFVREAPANDKPLFISSVGLPKGAYRRIGSSDVRCAEDDLQLFFQGRQSQTYDETILPDASPDDIDPEAVAAYRRARAEANPMAEELQWSDEDLLVALRCLKKTDTGLRPTVAGLILFGTGPAHRRCFPMMRADYIRVPGKEWVQDPDRPFESLEMRGPLMRLIRRIQATILDDLPRAFSFERGEMQRKENPVIPDRAIREAVVNSVMHRDYRVHGAVQVIRFANRVEIRNPGYSLVAGDRLGEPGSQTRNPTIAAVLHDTNYAETKGSGIAVMRRKMQEAGLPPPLFESDHAQNRFGVHFLFHHFLSPEDAEWLKRFRSLNLCEDDCRALIFVREIGTIDNALYRDLNHVDTLTASVHLRRLRDAGLLEAREKGSATYYVPTATLLTSTEAAIPVEGPSPTVAGAFSQGDGGLSQGDGGLSQGDGGLSQGVIAFPSGVTSTSEFDAMPADLDEAVKRFGKRSSPSDLQALLLRLCAWKPHRPDELAGLLGRRKDYLVRQYLGPMVAKGLLEYTIPETPSHFRQAYRTVAKLTKVDTR